MTVDIATLDYTVYLIDEDGDQYNLDKAVTDLAWEEQEGQLAQKVSISVAAECEVDEKNIREILKLNRMIRVFCDWGKGPQKLFDGHIWEWSYQHGQQKKLRIMAYDPTIRLLQCKDIKYFSPGMTTPAMLKNICGDWGVPLAYKWSKQITHEKKVFNAVPVSDMIMTLLEEVRRQSGERYVILYKDGALTVSAYGTNEDVYVFDEMNTISTSDTLTMHNLVTRVKIIGKEDNKGRTSVEAVIDGEKRFGILQEVIKRDNDKSLESAKSEAQATLKEQGQPEENIMVNSPDLPFLRKGDAVEMAAGNLIGRFYVLGVSHNATQKQMTMTLRRAEPINDGKQSGQ